MKIKTNYSGMRGPVGMSGEKGERGGPVSNWNMPDNWISSDLFQVSKLTGVENRVRKKINW